MLQNKQVFADAQGVSISVLDSWIYRHNLPVVKIGGRVYIDEPDYQSWVEDHKTIITQAPVKSMEIALPKQCRKSSIANKMRRIY